ncbi:MAG: hypothetical protein JST00_04910 [Deltaproteobacteria bacterium]|nr:hypothetical protein [Deltaproteobacteria bacterium]
MPTPTDDVASPITPAELDARLDAVERRLRALAELDARREVFGASAHGWALEAPMRAEAIAAFEALHDVTLPADARRFFARVASSGAGPHYGLAPLPMTLEGETVRGSLAWRMSQPFVGDTTTADEAAAIARDTSARGGYLVLADQGCGYKSILVLTGPRRGHVLSDMREAHEGFVDEAPSFLAWYERWLDRALVEWAMAALPDIVRVPSNEREPNVRAGLDAATPMLERLAQGELVDDQILAPKAERLRALVFLRAAQERFDEAAALVDRVRDLDERDPEPARLLTLSRLAGARADRVNQLAFAERGLADASAYYATHTNLLLEKQHALLGLGRREEALETAHARAKRTKDLFDYFDLAYVVLEEGDTDRAAQLLVEAARAGIGCDEERPLGERVLETAEGFLAALDAEGRDTEHTAVRARLLALSQLS